MIVNYGRQCYLAAATTIIITLGLSHKQDGLLDYLGTLGV